MTDPHADIAGYVLDALTAEEQQAVEAHLVGCPAGQRRLQEFTETIAQLSVRRAIPPPAQVRTNVLDAIAETPQSDAGSGDAQPGLNWSGEQTSQPTVSGLAAPRSGPARPGRGRRGVSGRRIGQIAVAAAIAVVLAVGGWTVGHRQLGQTVHAQQNARSRLLAAPDAHIYQQPMRGNGSVSYVVSRKHNTAIAIISGHPKPGKGNTFQLWTMHGPNGDQPRPDRTFTGNRSTPVWLKTNISDAAAVAITVEPDGGTDQPTTDPFAVQKL